MQNIRGSHTCYLRREYAICVEKLKLGNVCWGVFNRKDELAILNFYPSKIWSLTKKTKLL